MRISTQGVAGAGITLTVDGVTKVSLLTSLTPLALSEEQTLQTPPSQSVAVALSLGVPVVGAITGLTLAPGQLGVTEEIVSADVTAVPGISVVTVTDGLTHRLVQVAGLGVAVSTRPRVRAHTLPARHLGRSELRGAVVADLAFLTEVSHGVVLAVVADPGVRVTGVRVPVTLALPAVGEVPEAGLALATPPAECWLLSVAGTLAGVLVTELVL